MNLAGPVRRIGLTGGIGSGKSTVGARLQTLGAELIDADAISRASTAAGGAAISAVLERFGPDFIDSDGALNRARMRERVFADPSARHALEAIVHPIVARDMARRVAQSNKLCIVFDVPLLAVALRHHDVAYVGAMGSRRTHDDRLKRLQEEGLTDEELARLSSPIGLDLGARTPEETAVSIAAEIIAHQWGGSGQRLAGTDGRIHHTAARTEAPEIDTVTDTGSDNAATP